MDDELKIKMYSFTVDCIDPYELAKFYALLPKWETLFIEEEWQTGEEEIQRRIYSGIREAIRLI